MNTSTLLVRHLPSCFTTEDKENFLKHFGASSVRIMGEKGFMKNTAFAAFTDQKSAKSALKRMHQLEVMGNVLVVEFAKVEIDSGHPKFNAPATNSKNKENTTSNVKISGMKEADELTKLSCEINKLSSRWNLHYSLNPNLKYMYPPPSMTILTNIANALVAVPKLYVQVLHLMNKMNLPAPFGPITATPPIVSELQTPGVKENEAFSNSKGTDVTEPKDMDVSTSSESEISSDEEARNKVVSDATIHPRKRKKKTNMNVGSKIKVQKIVQDINKSKLPSATHRPEDVFEQPGISMLKKNMEFKITSELGGHPLKNPAAPESTAAPALERHVFTDPIQKIISLHKSNNTKTSDAILDDLLNFVELHEQEKTSDMAEKGIIPSIMHLLERYQKSVPSVNEVLEDLDSLCQERESSVLTSNEGFGKIESVKKDNENKEETMEESEEWDDGKFISSERLKRGRVSTTEMRKISVFKNYSPGDPSSRLYLKNVHPKTTEKDLHYIYGRYVDWDNDADKNMFDIRLMKEGRMKGQAFITLCNEASASKALKETNGFELNGKPIVVQFARSAKPKEVSDSKSKKE